MSHPRRFIRLGLVIATAAIAILGLVPSSASADDGQGGSGGAITSTHGPGWCC